VATESESVRNLVALIEALGSPDHLRRQRARQALVRLGRAAVPSLCEALRHEMHVIRWESAKALTYVASDEAADALRQALEDEDDGVRWLASEALIHLGRRGLRAALEAIVEKPRSFIVLASAHHVLHTLVDEGLAFLVQPVLDAIESPDREIRAPAAAEHALLELLKRDAAE